MRENVFQILKAVLAAVLFSLVSVLIFTLIVQFFSVPMGAVKPVNQVLKIASVAAGGIIFIRGEKGLIKGIIYGLAAVIITFLLYGIISSSLSFSWKFLIEIAIGAVAGGISGVIGVNARKKV